MIKMTDKPRYRSYSPGLSGRGLIKSWLNKDWQTDQSKCVFV